MVNHPWTETSRVTIVCVDDNRDGILGGRIYNGGALADGALAYGDSENVTGTFAAAHDITVDENSFERNGYTFLGWSVSPDGEVVYQPGQVISFVEGGSMTLYAQWQLEEYEYTVRYMVRVDGEAYAPFQGTLPAGAPQTGDPILIYVGMTALSGLGLLGLGLKKKDEDTE